MTRVPKFFNTAGPIQPDIHYNIDPLTRIDLEELESLIYQRKYFVLHAPRQTGKTSCLLALRDYLNARGEFYAVYVNVEAGQASFRYSLISYCYSRSNIRGTEQKRRF